MTILTTKLNRWGNFATVLAKKDKYGVNAVTYTNYTQAERKAEELRRNGINCEVMGTGVVKYVRINQ